MSLDALFSAFVTLLLVVDPLGLVPTYIAITDGLPGALRSAATGCFAGPSLPRTG